VVVALRTVLIQVLRPLRDITGVMQRMADGDLYVAVTGAGKPVTDPADTDRVVGQVVEASVADVDRALAELLGPGVDDGDLYFQHSRRESWTVEDGIVKDGAHSIEQGVGVRAISGEKTGFAYTDEIDLPALLAGQPLGTHLYVCGPKGMIAWVRATAEKAGWPRGAVHHEEFLAPPPGKVFDVTLAASGKTVTVGTHQSLLEAIEAAGVEAPYLCRGGACGQCETDVLACDGTIRHNDHWLTEAQKASGQKIMPCVSRFEGRSLVLDR
jgi:ferredoxin